MVALTGKIPQPGQENPEGHGMACRRAGGGYANARRFGETRRGLSPAAVEYRLKWTNVMSSRMMRPFHGLLHQTEERTTTCEPRTSPSPSETQPSRTGLGKGFSWSIQVPPTLSSPDRTWKPSASSPKTNGPINRQTVVRSKWISRSEKSSSWEKSSAERFSLESPTSRSDVGRDLIALEIRRRLSQSRCRRGP